MAKTICDSCIQALEDEGCPEGAEAMMAIDLGADIADHLCDQIEAEGDIFPNSAGTVLYACACSCHPRTTRREVSRT